MALTQKNRLLNLTTVLGPDVLLLSSFSGTEEMSQLFSYQLEMISDNSTIEPKQLVGTPIGWSILMADGTRRHWHGYVSQLTRGDVGESGRRNYRVEVVPWLWFLTQTSDCKIFQETTVPEIIDEVLGEFDIAKYKVDFQLEHKNWEYCVQYRETDFNFLSRLMEQEGITYFFKHSENEHELVITDHKDAYYDLPESSVDLPASTSDVAVDDHLTSWERQFRYCSGKYTQRDYNFKTPSNDLTSESKTIVDLPAIEKYELYDYPGEYTESPEGSNETKLRMEEEESQYELIQASSSCKSFQAGGRFQVGRHIDSSEEGAEVVIAKIHHAGSETMGYETGASYGFDYRNSFTCIPSSSVFRPARKTPKPIVNGIQTAVVTGPPGEEIFCDEYGRVKVQFHWDRIGQFDDKSSCWIRTAHYVAGAQWGFVALPRIGQEVVVNFLEGDPDRPLIVAGVYNAEQMPHYSLPDEKTKTYIKTNSSKGGEGFNELMFEDLQGEERLFLHAQKNMDTRVLNDSKSRIFGNRHQIIGWEKDGDKGGDQRERVYEDKHLNVKRHQVEHIEGDYQMMVGNGEADSGGNLHLVMEKNKLESIGGDKNLSVTGNHAESIGGDVGTSVGGNCHIKAGGNIAQEAGAAGEIHIKAGMKVIIEAGAEVTLKGPGGFIDINAVGVFIQGNMVMINSGGAAGSGSGCSPASPDEPEQAAPAEPLLAHNSTTGHKSSPD